MSRSASPCSATCSASRQPRATRCCGVWQIFDGSRSAAMPTVGSVGGRGRASFCCGNRYAPRWPVSLCRRGRSPSPRAGLSLGRAGHRSLRPGRRRIAARSGCPPSPGARLLGLLPVSASCFVTIMAQSAATSRGIRAPLSRERRRRRRHPRPLGRERRRRAERNVRGQWQSDADRDGRPRRRAQPDRAARRSRVLARGPLAGRSQLQYLPRCVLAAIVFTIAVGMIDVRIARHPPRKPGRVLPRHRHRRDGRRDRRRAGDLARDRALAVPARAAQLPSAHDDARARCDRPVDARARDAGQGHRARAHRLSVRRGSLLRQSATASPTRCARWSAYAPARSAASSIDAAAITDIDYSAARSIRDLLEETASATACA